MSSRVMQANRGRASRLAMVGLVGLLLAVVAPTSALAQETHIKLSLRPIGQTGSFFDLTLRPGETRRLAVEISNVGTAAIAARTYASDVYTIVDGGFGARLRDEPQTGVTGWLDYRTDVVGLAIGETIRQTFRVAVPRGTGPGEYITSLVLENEDPIRDSGPVALDQIVRQAIAVVITVPGLRAPALSIGQASHAVVAGKSVVAIAVGNPGNVRLKPVAAMTLRDAAGVQVSEATLPMDTFYAGTSTSIEVRLDQLLLPGIYTIQLSIDDAVQGARASGVAEFVVEPPTATVATGEDAILGLIPVIQVGPNGASLPAIGIGITALGLGVVLLIGLISFVLRRRRRTNTTDR